MRVYSWNSPEITEVDLNMSIRAVKDNRACRKVCVYVCVLESERLGVESERQRVRLRVKLTADWLVLGQRAQTNLITEGRLSKDLQTVKLLQLSFSDWLLWEFNKLRDFYKFWKAADTSKRKTRGRRSYLFITLAERRYTFENLLWTTMTALIPQPQDYPAKFCHERVKGAGALPQWEAVGVSGRHGASVLSDYSQRTGEAR